MTSIHRYVAVDDVHVNGKLTLGENVADLGGEILAYMAWKDADKDKNLQPIDGLTPEQRFFIGFAQWDCANERPEDMRVRTMTDPHSPPRYRINGVVVNMPEFRGGILLQSRPAHGEAGGQSVPSLVNRSVIPCLGWRTGSAKWTGDRCQGLVTDPWPLAPVLADRILDLWHSV